MATNAWGVAPPAATNWGDAAEAEEAEHGAVLAPLKRADDDFPSLAVTKNVKESKKAKQKQQKMSLTDFMKSAGRPSDDDILANLPTAPRTRAPGEAPPERGMGGGFREYGGQRGGFGRGRDDDDRGPRRGREEDMGPSRAEMSDNWGKDRKFESSGPSDRGYGGGGGYRDSFRERDSSRDGGFRRERTFDDGPSRADTTDNWGANRQFVPSSRGAGFEDRPRGGGFGDRDRDRGDRERPSFRDREFREPSKADTQDRWERRGDFQPTAFEDRPRGGERFDDRPRGRGFGESWGGARDGSREGPRRESFRDRDDFGRDRDASQDKWKREEGGAAPPAAAGERPRLNLAPRTAAPPAAAADKAAEAGGAAAAPAPSAPKSNPFGAARPREEVLKEQGRDYRKEELQLEHKAAEVLREETEEERALAKEIDDLRVKVEAGEADAPLDPSEGAEGKTVSQALDEAEQHLARLQLELDDKVRYARQQRGGDRGDRDREGPRRDEGEGGGAWGRRERGPGREEGGRAFSRERPDSRRFDSRDRRHDDDRRGFDDRGDRRDYAGRSYRDAAPRSESREGGGSRW